jgi:S-DNA-T family DNA segregation ATPase FtsK/SpoIIIE
VSTTLRRGPRLAPPEAPHGQLALQPPPDLQPHEGGSAVLVSALPMLGSVGSIVFVAATQPGPRGYLAAGMFLMASLGFVVVSVWRQWSMRQSKVDGLRRGYLRYLAEIRDTARNAAHRQREALTWSHPDPDHLAILAEERTRVWERSVGDPDFFIVRYGLSARPLALDLVPPDTAPIDQVDPVAASALHRLVATHRTQPDLPAAVDLSSFARIEVSAKDGAAARALARAVLAQAAAFHSPEHLLIAVVATETTWPEWEWVKWLPHAQSPREYDGAGPARLVTTSLSDLVPLLPADLADRPRFGPVDGAPALPHVIVVVDGGQVPPPGNHLVTEDGVLGVTVLDLPEGWNELDDPTRLRLHLPGDVQADGRPALSALRYREQPVIGSADQLSAAAAEAFARRLTPLHIGGGPATQDPLTGPTDFMDLLGLDDVRSSDLELAWRQRPARDRLRVPIGVAEDGSPVHLDLKESAQQGIGPHGLVIGATGSGKSELLRTLVLGLAMTHSPETLNLVLVDFKGGATFAGMADLPHVSALITNLEQEITLVDRMQEALTGELIRRQELLRAAGNLTSVTQYEKARAGGQPLEPLPSLFICVDEFSELLSAKPEFIDLFVAIGRLGRSLGLHLLLASQRLEEGRLRGLDSHLSYRIGLRTFSAQESRTVLGVADAYDLPPVPGLGYLQPDPSTLVRFKAAYVSGPPPELMTEAVGARPAAAIVPFTTAPVAPPRPAGSAESSAAVRRAPVEQRSVLEIAVQRMAEPSDRRTAHQVWPPPLDRSDTLDSLMPDLSADPELGLVSRSWRARGDLVLPLGTVDRPLEQRRDTLVADLGGPGGHVSIVGGPRTGKSTLARTLVTSLALTRTPAETQIYVLDFGGGTFAPLAGLPHVSGVATRAEPDVVRRVGAEVQGIVDRREAYFRRNGIDSIETYRGRRCEGRADDGYGDVFLVVDGWSTLRAEFETLEMELQELAQRGLTFGVHLVAATSRWTDFRAAVRDVFGTRLELRLGDTDGSEVDRRLAANVPVGRPGRGLLPTGHHYLGALPRLDGDSDPATLGRGVEHLVAAVSEAWRGAHGPKLRLLPERIELDRVRAAASADDRRLLVGIDERDLAPVGLDLNADPHLLVFGDGGAGKSALLRTYAHEVMRTRGSGEAGLVLVDYRRALVGEVADDYLVDYLTSSAGPAISELADYLRSRLPGPAVTPEQLRTRSWWSGADVFVIVDDYDLVATSAGSPLLPLVELLPQARDVGLHVVVARRTGGAARALYEPVVQSLRDLAAPGIVLSGNPDEGPLIGPVRPQPAAPGRGRLVTRARGVEVVQVAWLDPALYGPP